MIWSREFLLIDGADALDHNVGTGHHGPRNRQGETALEFMLIDHAHRQDYKRDMPASLPDLLRTAFDRLVVLVAENDFACPLLIRLIDANARCLLTMQIIGNGRNWTEQGELNYRGSVPFPWFVAAEDAAGQTVQVCIESLN